MLCPRCHRQTPRRAAFCPSCGNVREAGAETLELVLPDRTRVALDGTLRIGRAAGSTIRLDDPAVSRVHATISAPLGVRPLLSDAGSRYGTFIDGARVDEPVELHSGSTLRVGDTDLRVEQHRPFHQAGGTMVLRAGMSLSVQAFDE